MQEHLQGAEVVLHGEEGEEVSRWSRWVPEHLQGVARRLCSEVAENLFPVWRDWTQQAHMSRPHLLSLCRPVRSSLEDRITRRQGAHQDPQHTTHILNKTTKTAIKPLNTKTVCPGPPK